MKPAWDKLIEEFKDSKTALVQTQKYTPVVKNLDFLKVLGSWAPDHGPEYGIWISGYLDMWISGYLDIWIFGYLDSGQNNGLMHPQSGFLCGVALPGVFFPEKTGPWCFCNLKHCVLHSTKTIFNGTRLDRRGLKS